jgi:uncharacterized protein involved in exopolysaccharide biosynthesis
MNVRELEATFTLRGLVGALREGWVLPAALAALFLAAGAAVAFLATPIYRAEVVAVPVPDQEARGALSGLSDQLGGLAPLAGINLGGGQDAQAIATLRSRALVAQLIRDENLLPVLYEKLWDKERKAWLSDDPRGRPTEYKAQEFFINSVLRVTEDRSSGLVIVRVEWPDPRLAAHWATALVNRANAVSQRRALEEAQSSINYLQARLESTDTVELRQAIYRLMEAQLKQIVVASSRAEYAFRVVDPALVPDADSFVRPRRALLLVLSPVVGFVIGFFFLLWRRTSGAASRPREA